MKLLHSVSAMHFQKFIDRLRFSSFARVFTWPSTAPTCTGQYSRMSLVAPVAQFDLKNIDHFLITHVHGDHMNGLEGVAFFKHFAENKRVQLLSVPEVCEVIWSERLKGSMGQLWNGSEFRSLTFDDYFDFKPLEWASVTSVGPFNIQVRRTKHHIPTCAVRIEAKGRVFGYSSDTAFDPELIQFLEPAHLIIHETNLGPAHTNYTSLTGLAADLRRRMRLIHYPDGFDSKTSVIPVIHEGEVHNV